MNHWIRGALATCTFELRRSFTIQRMAVSLVLALFPPAILLILILASTLSGDPQAQLGIQDFTKLITVFMVALVCLLTTLLWATPNVYSEVEGKSWSFVASRPGGRISVFLGKFLASFFVSFVISLIAVSLCIWLANRSFGMADAQKVWLAMAGVFFLGCMVYSAVFSMIGTLFIKRSMVIGAGYLIGSDVILASIPGVLINKLTIRYHLQEIGIAWLGWFMPAPSTENDYRMVFGESMSWPVHVLIVVAITLAVLAIGARVISIREYITADES